MIDLSKLRHHQWGCNWNPDIDDLGTASAEWTGKVYFDGNDGDDSFEFAPDEDYSVDLIEYVCNMHNALPVLLEIARAARAWREATAAVNEALRAQHAAQVAYHGCGDPFLMTGLNSELNRATDSVSRAINAVSDSEQALRIASAKVIP